MTMQATADQLGMETHEVFNQAGEFVDYNAYRGDKVLTAVATTFGAQWAKSRLTQVGEMVGSRRIQALARQANRAIPELRTHDRFGHRIDEIELHPAWHALMRECFESETHSLAWTVDHDGRHVARAALSYLWNQAENGICCPMGMTFASVAALRHVPELAQYWEPHILSASYDPRPLPAEQKSGLTVGMAMTEKQGGSDLRRTQTVARTKGSARGSGAAYLLTGHKWFFSVPQSDLILTLAQTDKGVSCFLARGWLENGQRNRLNVQRLKDKCGNRSNASSEVEFRGLEAVMVGEEGRGIRNLIEMAHLTRLDFAVGSAGLMRQALSQAIHHTSNRQAFQRRLVDQPIMAQVLSDLAIESEATTWMSFRVAATLDHKLHDEGERLLGRIAVPMAKYWACKRAPAFVAEALECHGGNGFIEDHLMSRLYREAPLNGIWEGTGNVVCLDVLRAVEREPATVDAFLSELRKAQGEPYLDAAIDELELLLPKLPTQQQSARYVVGLMASAFQASLLLRHSTADVAHAFCEAKLSGGWAGHYGAVRQSRCTDAIIERARISTS